MKNWKTKYTAKFPVRTASDRAVDLNCCSIESAEYVRNQGRRRLIWKWVSYDSRYACFS